MNKFTLVIVTIGALLSGCGGSTGNAPTAATPNPDQGAKPPRNAAQTTKAVSDPAKVVGELFAAGRSGDTSKLAGLCMPDGSSDSDMKEICSYAAATPEKLAKFKEYFGSGGIQGEPKIEGDKAVVSIKFGPDGNRDEKIELKKVDGNWYLASM